MEMNHHAITWAEIPVTDFERAKKFYSTIYDYQMPDMMMGPNRMGFLLFDQQKDGIGAAIVKGDGYIPSAFGVKIYLAGGSDLDIILNKVTDAGGKVFVKKTLVTPEYGYIGVFQDTEGNVLSLHSIK